MLKRAIFVVLGVATGLFSVGGISVELSPRGTPGGVFMLLICLCLTILFFWLAFRKWDLAPKAGADELVKYAELRDKGVLTDAEFQAKKHEILGG